MGTFGFMKSKQAKNCRTPDWTDFIWVVYSVFYFIEPIARNKRGYWIQFAVVYAIFLAIYTGMVFARSRRTLYLLLGGLTALGIYYFPYNQAAYGMFLFVAAWTPFITESLPICLGTFAAMIACIVGEGYYYHLNPWSWVLGIFLTIVVGGGNLFLSQRVRANSKLRLAHEEIEQLAKLAERERIARDLHDVLGHTLSVIVLKSELAGRLFSRNPERAAAEIADVEQIARQALTEVREAIRGYRAEGLTAEIRRAHSVLDAAGVTLVCEEVPLALGPTEESVLSLVLREAVTNIVRHAQASRCVLRFQEQDGQTVLVVEDDGRGGIREDGNGVRGMRARIEALGGRFAVNTSPGASHGTRLTIQIPTGQLPAASAQLHPA